MKNLNIGQENIVITQDCWVVGFFMSFGILENRKQMIRKLDLFPSSGEGRGKTPTLLGPLEKANLNHCSVF
jgi:hypothetical protein